jgi:hypothetical protein
MIAIISIGYDYSVAVPIDKVSAVLAALTAYPRVDTSYRDGREIAYPSPDMRPPRVMLIDALSPAPAPAPAPKSE